MTCVLSMPTFHTFDDGLNLANNYVDDADSCWTNSGPTHYSTEDGCNRCCRLEACRNKVGDKIVTSKIGTNYSATVCGVSGTKQTAGPVSVQWEDDWGIGETILVTENRLQETKPGTDHEQTDVASYHSDINNNDAGQDSKNGIGDSKGVKRKADSEETEQYMPSKRIPVFLNTPKQKKVEKKKIIKLSVKKLKSIEDPEIVLRRAVLVNNTLKKLQFELREEKKQKKQSYRRKLHVHNDLQETDENSLSHFFHDENLTSAEHEKITDDMTDVLVYNVLNSEADGISDVDEIKHSERPAGENIEYITNSGNTEVLSCNSNSSSGDCTEQMTETVRPEVDSKHNFNNNKEFEESCEHMDLCFYVQLIPNDEANEQTTTTL